MIGGNVMKIIEKLDKELKLYKPLVKSKNQENAKAFVFSILFTMYLI